MDRLCRVALAALVISLGVIAQSPPRKWAGAAEYSLATEAFQQGDPNRRIVLLRQWESQYPRTDFERERIFCFAVASRRLGQFNESFMRATELLKLDANDPGALLLVVTLGPSLPSPSARQITTVMDSASKLQSVKPAPSPASTEPGMVSRQPADPENQQILAFIRELHRDRAATHPNPEVLKNQVIESALAWARNLKR